MKLLDKVAIITGGGSGLGKEACFQFAREGAIVVVADYNATDAYHVCQTIVQQGLRATWIAMDVSNRESVKDAVEYVVKTYNRIDILINNAGVTGDAFVDMMKEETFDKVINVNLKGVFNCTQAVVPIMKEQKYGKIVSTSSVVGIYGNVGQTSYSASKAGVIGMTKTWAKELGRYNIYCNAVAPGFIETPMTEGVPNKVLELMREKTPLKRLGKPEEIAKVYLFLASDDASYINGAVLSVDGGLTL